MVSAFSPTLAHTASVGAKAASGNRLSRTGVRSVAPSAATRVENSPEDSFTPSATSTIVLDDWRRTWASAIWGMASVAARTSRATVCFLRISSLFNSF